MLAARLVGGTLAWGTSRQGFRQGAHCACLQHVRWCPRKHLGTT
jgi:hypothetical protein